MLLSRSVTLSIAAFVVASVGIFAGCKSARDGECSMTALQSDPENCGFCGNACGDGTACIKGACKLGACQPGATEDCYTGVEGTEGIGTCVGGKRTCSEDGLWLGCEGQVIPVAENCNDALDNNCNGAVDENADNDEDGFTTCGVPGVIAGDCCDSTECTKPKLVNAGAFDAAGNNLDDDCNGIIDDTLLLCDQDLNSNSTVGLDFARAIDVCQVATDVNRSWGVIDAKMTLTDGTDVPDKEGYAIRPRFGAGVVPQGGVSLAIISTGGAAGVGDINPGFHPWESYSHTGTTSAPYPEPWYSANGNAMPNAPGCTVSNPPAARDPVMFTMRLRVPTNAKSFRLSTNFFSAEFPEYTCSTFNDFFVVLLDSTYTGDQPNPMDGNLAFFTTPTMQKVPVGVNLAHGNTGLFTQCVNGPTGCNGVPGMITTCTSTEQLAGTGLDAAASGGPCAVNDQRVGGGTGWLVTRGNVVPGEIITLRVAIWDTQDQAFDSVAIFDGFAWSTELADPGTVIF